MATLSISKLSSLLLCHFALVSFGVGFRVTGDADQKGTHEGFCITREEVSCSFLNRFPPGALSYMLSEANNIMLI